MVIAWLTARVGNRSWATRDLREPFSAYWKMTKVLK